MIAFSFDAIVFQYMEQYELLPIRIRWANDDDFSWTQSANCNFVDALILALILVVTVRQSVYERLPRYHSSIDTQIRNACHIKYWKYWNAITESKYDSLQIFYN